MKVIKLKDTNEFTPEAMKRFFLVEDSPSFKIINFNLDEGVTFPILISEIREPHGVRATTRMRILVTIAPPI